MNIIGIIPARMGSSRFPGKPLATIAGMPMIEHVYKRVVASDKLAGAYVATCDAEIKEVVESFGGKAVMTKDSHERASDRVAEAMLKIEEATKERVDIPVMIQGDEPLVFPEMIAEAVDPMLEDARILVTNLMGSLKSKQEQEDRNEIKVVIDKEDNALYFSREPIPSKSKTTADIAVYKQVCIIPFRREFLLEFNALAQTPLEIIESIDMLRVLENGRKVKMVKTQFETYSVDTKEDLKRAERVMLKDYLYQGYKIK